MASKFLFNYIIKVAIACFFSFLLIGCTALHVAMSPEQENPDFKFVRTYSFPLDVVYSNLMNVIERNDRKILNTDVTEHSLLIEWPTSFLLNRWGGRALIKCEANENGTIVRIGGYSERASQGLGWIVAKQIFNDLSSSLNGS